LNSVFFLCQTWCSYNRYEKQKKETLDYKAVPNHSKKQKYYEIGCSSIVELYIIKIHAEA